MSFLVCERHNRFEKSGSNVMTSGQICLQRECLDGYKVICEGCKKDHRNHAIKLLTIEDVFFLLDRLVKMPFRAMVKPIGEALNIINQLKHIKEFRKKIEILEEEIHEEAIMLIQHTEVLIKEYSRCRKNASNLAQLFNEIDEADSFEKIVKDCKEMLSGLDYNVKKDRFQYGNALIREMEQKRSQTAENAKEKIVQVRDYSMKIIEVILNNYEFDDQGEDLQYKHQQYKKLKEQLRLEREKNDEKNSRLAGQSRSTTHKSQAHKLNHDKQMQTEHQMFTKLQLDLQIQSITAQLSQTHSTIQTDFKSKLQVMTKQRESLTFQLAKWKQKFSQKQKSIRLIESQLRGTRHTRNDKLKIREDLVNNIIQIWNTKSDGQDSHL